MFKAHKANLRHLILTSDPSLNLALESPGFAAAATLLIKEDEEAREEGDDDDDDCNTLPH